MAPDHLDSGRFLVRSARIVDLQKERPRQVPDQTTMTSVFGDPCNDDCISSWTSKPSSSVSTPIGSTSQSEDSLVRDMDTYPFSGIASMQQIITGQCDRLLNGESNQQYMIFTGVTEVELDMIDSQRHLLGKHLRMTHYLDRQLLVVKLMPSVQHEMAHLELARMFIFETARLGMPIRSYAAVGAGRYRGDGSSKEGDSAFKPKPQRQKDEDWPTLVFEAGLSEGLDKLRRDAQWWLEQSNGDVNIVVIISINPSQRLVHIEKWELILDTAVVTGRPLTRASNKRQQVPNKVPEKVQEITVAQNCTDETLILEFEKVFLRPAIAPEEDIRFTAMGLSDFAADLWQ